MGTFSAISTKSKKAIRIIEFLTKELDMPEHVAGFTLEMRMDSAVKVTNMDYFPVDDEKVINNG